MSDISHITPHERETYREYDYRRRLQLARIIAPTFLMAEGAFTLILTVVLLRPHPPSQSSLLFVAVVCWLVFGCFALGVGAVRRERANLAAVCLVAGEGLGAAAIVLYGAFIQGGIDEFEVGFLLAFALAIVVSGALGNPSLLLTVSILAVFLAAGILLFGIQTPSFASKATLTTLMILALLLALVGVMVAFQRGYQRTLHDLGDTRIAYERARQLDDLKNQFIVNVNHELRNPVMAMMGHLDVLDMSLAGAPPERLQSLTQGALRASEHLRTLLASILDASRMEHGSNDFTPELVPLASAIQAAMRLLNPTEGGLIEREIRVQISDGLAIWGEPIRLRQILTNLLSNALKYSPPGTPIEVTAQVVTEQIPGSSWHKHSTPDAERELVEITVRDWGLGIPPEQVPLLFNRFVRLPRDLASTIVGNGLGLYVCRLCTEAMRGRIWVESSGVEGEGTTFHIRLPYRSSEAQGIPVVTA